MDNIGTLLLQSTAETLWMVAVAAPACVLAGLMLGMLLVATAPGGVRPSAAVHQVIAAITNLARSVPFLILIVVLLPVTRMLVGTSIGTAAAIVPLVLGGIPYAARLSEAALLEVDPELVLAVTTMGASPCALMLKVYLPEALPGLIRAFTVLTITIVNFSAMAGVVGGGGLGDLAIRFGYQRFRPEILAGTVLVLVVLVQSLQWSGNLVAQRLDRR